MSESSRRDALRLLAAGVGGVVYSSQIFGCGSHRMSGVKPATGGQSVAPSSPAPFSFVQLSDTHWGFAKEKFNPDPKGTLRRAIAATLSVAPDFVVFTGDLTHRSEDESVRDRRMTEFKEALGSLKTGSLKTVHFLCGEHDADADQGRLFRKHFGDLYWSFDHKGAHFLGLDNASSKDAEIGAAQLEWLHNDLDGISRDTPLVVFSHRPLFELRADWGWATKDGDKVQELLARFSRVNAFYGHIHQAHRHQQGNISFQSARSLIFPLPPPDHPGPRKPIPWNSEQPYANLGGNTIEVSNETSTQSLDLVASNSKGW